MRNTRYSCEAAMLLSDSCKEKNDRSDKATRDYIFDSFMSC